MSILSVQVLLIISNEVSAAWCRGWPDAPVAGADVLDELDAAALAPRQRRHVLDGQRVVEGVAAPRVLGAVALETVDVVASWQYSHYLLKTKHFAFN